MPDRMPDKTYTLLGPDGPYESPRKGTLGGNKSTGIYGTMDCPTALSWIARGKYVDNRVFFADEATAIASKFRPCGRCLPERYEEWKAGGQPRARRPTPGSSRRDPALPATSARSAPDVRPNA